ncbi:DUF2752 domain-containing protein [Lacinutrix salivirga]
MFLAIIFEGLEEYMLPCLNKQLLGFECLGCGLQRALKLIFQGKFIDAFKMYPAIYTLIPLGALIGLNFFYKFKHSNKIINYLAIASVLIIITSFLIKQLN